MANSTWSGLVKSRVWRSRRSWSRALRGLAKKGLVRRDVDAHDARRVRLHPTGKAQENPRRQRETWRRLLDGIVTDGDEIATVIAALRRIEARLARNPDRQGESR